MSGQALKCQRCNVTVSDGGAHYREVHGLGSTEIPLSEWVRAVAEGFPTPTAAQIDRLTILLYPPSTARKAPSPSRVDPLAALIGSEEI